LGCYVRREAWGDEEEKESELWLALYHTFI
jgi:hypothetical protein